MSFPCSFRTYRQFFRPSNKANIVMFVVAKTVNDCWATLELYIYTQYTFKVTNLIELRSCYSLKNLTNVKLQDLCTNWDKLYKWYRGQANFCFGNQDLYIPRWINHLLHSDLQSQRLFSTDWAINLASNAEDFYSQMFHKCSLYRWTMFAIFKSSF